MQSFDVGFASLPETEKFGKSKRPNSRWALCCTPAADDAHSTQCRCCKFCLMVSCCRAFVLWTSSLIRAKHEARMWLLSLEMGFRRSGFGVLDFRHAAWLSKSPVVIGFGLGGGRLKHRALAEPGYSRCANAFSGGGCPQGAEDPCRIAIR